MIEKAVTNYDGTSKFFPVINGNVGASSLFQANPENSWSRAWSQREIEVPCIRMDTFMKESNIDSVEFETFANIRRATINRIPAIIKVRIISFGSIICAFLLNIFEVLK